MFEAQFFHCEHANNIYGTCAHNNSIVVANRSRLSCVSTTWEAREAAAAVGAGSSAAATGTELQEPQVLLTD